MTAVDVVAGLDFVAGRVRHTLVQTLTDNVPLRGQVFMINFLAVRRGRWPVVLLALEGSPVLTQRGTEQALLFVCFRLCAGT